MRKKIIGKILVVIGMISIAYNSTVQIGSELLQRNIADKVTRFHVVANSDSDEDQQLKLKVRDAIGKNFSTIFNGATCREESDAVINKNLGRICDCAHKVIIGEGYDYKVSARVTEEYFPEKTYGQYTFSAGQYHALKVEIGEAKGHNWWCVLYPEICFKDNMYIESEGACEELQNMLTEEEYASIMSKGNYGISLKIKHLHIIEKCSETIKELLKLT